MVNKIQSTIANIKFLIKGMKMVLEQIEGSIRPGMIIPKPAAKGDFIVKGWGKRRGERALIYYIPNRSPHGKPYEKGITETEWEIANDELKSQGRITRQWFNECLPECAKEGGCNFTTIGGIFELLGIAEYGNRGEYRLIDVST